VSTVVDRPRIDFDEGRHVYRLDGRPVPGVSTIAKAGQDSWGMASAWGYNLGRQGASTVLREHVAGRPDRDDALAGWPSDDALKEELKERKLTPWSTRNKAAKRGSAVHDALEALAQHGEVPDPKRFPEAERGHVLSLVRWYLHYRPTFIATEVMVGSRTYSYAGRYDIRATIELRRFVEGQLPPELAPPADGQLALDGQAKTEALVLVDLKTSKGIYPTEHFPQLEGYEGASREMGFPASDARFVLNTKPDGSFKPERDFVRSTATFDDFLAYLNCHRARKRIEKASKG
jgi:hypothetical protein